MFRRGEKYKTRQQTKKIEKAVAGLKTLYQDLDKHMKERDPAVKEALVKELERRLDEEDDGYVKKKLDEMLIRHLEGKEQLNEKESQTEPQKEEKKIEVVTLDDTPVPQDKTIEVITLDESTSRCSSPFKQPIYRNLNDTITIKSPSINDSRRLTRSSQDLAKFLLRSTLNRSSVIGTPNMGRIDQEEPEKKTPWWTGRNSIPMEMSSPQSPW